MVTGIAQLIERKTASAQFERALAVPQSLSIPDKCRKPVESMRHFCIGRKQKEAKHSTEM